MQSQLKTIQPQLKALRKKGKKQLSQKVFLLQVQIPIFNCKGKDLQGGTLCGPVLWNCLKDFNKENSFFEQGKVFDLGKVCFFLLLKRMQSQLKTIHSQLKSLRKKVIKKSCIHTKSQLALWQFSIGKSDNLGIFWKLCAAIANAAQLLQMLWTKIDVCNWKSIRSI